jgi:hypothetical protein
MNNLKTAFLPALAIFPPIARRTERLTGRASV